MTARFDRNGNLVSGSTRARPVRNPDVEAIIKRQRQAVDTRMRPAQRQDPLVNTVDVSAAAQQPRRTRSLSEDKNALENDPIPQTSATGGLSLRSASSEIGPVDTSTPNTGAPSTDTIASKPSGGNALENDPVPPVNNPAPQASDDPSIVPQEEGSSAPEQQAQPDDVLSLSEKDNSGKNAEQAGTVGATAATSGFAAAWPLAIALAAIDGYTNLDAAEKELGTKLTDDESAQVMNPYGLDDYFGDEAEDTLKGIGVPKELMHSFHESTVSKMLGFGSTKHEDQIRRDRARNHLKDNVGLIQMVDGKHSVELADGSFYDVGIDGGARLDKDFDPNKILSTDQSLVDGNVRPYNVDYTNDLDYMTSIAANTLTGMAFGGSSKSQGDMGGYLTNAATSQLESREFTYDNWVESMKNIRKFYSDSGITSAEMAYSTIDLYLSENKITEDQANEMRHGIALAFSGSPQESYELAQKLNENRWNGTEFEGAPPEGEQVAESIEGETQQLPEGAIPVEIQNPHTPEGAIEANLRSQEQATSSNPDEWDDELQATQQQAAAEAQAAGGLMGIPPIVIQTGGGGENKMRQYLNALQQISANNQTQFTINPLTREAL